ncbi:NAD(P)/FAD-dependent oxidoreductase [Paenibacillus sp. CGMCC 1.16610]|uniref:Pyridine nucleotide-disulfide oxidoreductase n=1 Tax=Paenibacillus anseongense TaxID=2682845 RepID=A0ABW9UN80_9BACL|nr:MULTISPECIES: NAD(P)/FAD-dependent oxidoreductase [Paenibacillus]MBA2941349.1 NAD(P)/FAD-dependent oxidoreductase [Paenibacillus sp. CGMCC 1.16610]MVQ40168.1 pyridine nucleotide-disulfide oxidoreductase [Paenibacillus anseongense]
MAKQILILGGGYGGLLTALTARKHLTASEANITIINRFPTHQIITELHRLAGGTIKEQAVALPLQRLLGNKQVNIVVDTIKEIKPDDKKVITTSGAVHTYDALVVALGSETNYFGIPGLEENSMVLKSASDANRIREHVEARLDAYKASGNKADATIVVGGGGLTGVELVGEFADKLPEVCRSKGIDFSDVSIYCVEAGPAILPVFPKVLIERAVESLEKRGVTFLTGVAITEATKNTVSLKSGQTIESNTIIWTGGVKGNPVVGSCGIAEDRGRATVTSTLQSTSHSNVFLAGDCAVVFPEGGERPYPPTAQLAWQMGETVGYNLSVQVKGGAMDKFVPVFSGTLGSLGRKDGIGTIGGNNTQLKGLPASLMKEASNIRYLSHINGLSALAY